MHSIVLKQLMCLINYFAIKKSIYFVKETCYKLYVYVGDILIIFEVVFSCLKLKKIVIAQKMNIYLLKYYLCM